MKSVNVQHNDIKIGEILVDENKKIYLCDRILVQHICIPVVFFLITANLNK